MLGSETQAGHGLRGESTLCRIHNLLALEFFDFLLKFLDTVLKVLMPQSPLCEHFDPMIDRHETNDDYPNQSKGEGPTNYGVGCHRGMFCGFRID